MPDYAAELAVLIGSDTAPAEKGLDTVTGKLNRIASTSGSIGSAVASGVRAGATALTGLGVASVGAAMSFEQGMRNVNAIAQLSESQWEGVKDQILAFALTTRAQTDELAGALYHVVSAGLELDESVKSATFEGKQMSEAMAVMQASSRGAGAGLANVEYVTELLIGAMQSYNLSADDTIGIMDIFLHTVNQGIVTLPELTSTLGRVLPIASQLGVSLEEVGFTVAQLTRGGLDAFESTTSLRSTFIELLQPTKEMEQVLNRLGVSSGTQLIEKFGGLSGALRALTQTVFESTITVGGMTEKQKLMAVEVPFLKLRYDELTESMAKLASEGKTGEKTYLNQAVQLEKVRQKIEKYEGSLASVTEEQRVAVVEQFNSNEQIAAMFNNVRSLTGIMSLLDNEVWLSADALTQFGEEAKNAVYRAREQQYASFATTILRIKNAVRVVAIEIGDALLPTLNDLGKVVFDFVVERGRQLIDWVKGVGAAFTELPLPIRAGILGFIGLTGATTALSPVLATLSPLIGTFGRTLLSIGGPLSIVIGLVTALGIAYTNNFFGIKDAIDEIIPKIREFADNVLDMGRYLFNVLESGNVFNEWLKELPASWQDAARGMGDFLSEWADFGDTLRDNLAGMKADLNEFFTTGVSDFPTFAKVFEALGSTIEKTFGQALSRAVAWVTENADDIAKAFLSWASGAVDWIGHAAETMLPYLAEFLGNIVEWIIGTGVPNLIDAGTKLAQSLGQGFAASAPDAVNAALKDLGRNLTVALSNIGAGLEQFGTILAQHVFSGLVQAVGYARADEIFESIGEAFARLETIFKPTIDRIKAAIAGFGESVAPLVEKFEALWTAAKPALERIGMAVAAVAVVVSKLFGEVIAQAIERIGPIIGAFVDMLTSSLNTITTVIDNVFAGVAAAVEGDWTGIWTAAFNIIDAFSADFEAKLQGLISIADNVFGGVYDAVVNTLNDLVGTSLPVWDELKGGIERAFQGVSAFLGPLFDTLKSVFADLGQAVRTFIVSMEPVAQRFAELWEATQPLREVLGAVLGPILQVIGKLLLVLGGGLMIAAIGAITFLGETISSVLSHAGEIIGGFISILTGFYDFLSGIFGYISAVVKAVFEGDFEGAFQKATEAIQHFRDGAANMLQGVVDIFIGLFGTIYDAVVGTINKIPGVSLPAWSELTEGMRNSTADLVAKIKGDMTDLEGTMAGAGEAGAAAVDSWMMNMQETSTASVAFAGDMEDAWIRSKDAMKQSVDEMGPVWDSWQSSVTQASSDTATEIDAMRSSFDVSLGEMKAILDEPVAGLDNLATQTGTAASSVLTELDTLSGGFEEKFRQMSVAPEQAIAGMEEVVTTGFQKLDEAGTISVSSLTENISADFDAMKETVTTQAQSMLEGADSFFGADMSEWGTAVSTLSDTVTNSFTTMNEAVTTSTQEMLTAATAFFGTDMTEWTSSIATLSDTVVTSFATMSEAITTTTQEMLNAATVFFSTDTSDWTNSIDALSETVTTDFGVMLEAVQTSSDAMLEAAEGFFAVDTDDWIASIEALTESVVTGFASMAEAVVIGSELMLESASGYFTEELVLWGEHYTTLGATIDEYFLAATTAYAERYAQLTEATRIGMYQQSVVVQEFYNYLIGQIIVPTMDAVVSHTNSGWLGALGAMRSILQLMRSDAQVMISNVAGAVSSQRGAFVAAGSSLMGGLRAGILSKAGEIAAAAAAVVRAAISAARAAAAISSPSRHMYDMGLDLMAGLQIGLEQTGATAIDTAGGIMERLLHTVAAEAQVQSPSTFMHGVGWNLIMGLVLGIQEATPDAVNKASDAIKKVMDALSSTVQTLEKLGEFEVRPINLTGLQTSIKATMQQLVELGEFFAQAPGAASLETAKNVLDPLKDIFSDLGTVLDKVEGLAGLENARTIGAKVISAMTGLSSAVKEAVRILADTADAVTDRAVGDAARVAAAASIISNNLAAASGAFGEIRGFFGADLSESIGRLTQTTEYMISALSDAARRLGGASQRAQDLSFYIYGIANTLADSIEAFRLITRDAYGMSEQVFQKAFDNLLENIEYMTRALSEANDLLGQKTLRLSEEMAGHISQILAPWTEAVETMLVIATGMRSSIEPTFRILTGNILYMVEQLAAIKEQLGDEAISLAIEISDNLIALLEPWNAAMDLFERMGAFIWRRLAPVAGQIGASVTSQISKLRWIALELGPEALDLARQIADNLVALLEPWNAAMDLFERMGTFIWRRLAPVAGQIANSVKSQISKLRWLALELGPEAIDYALKMAENLTAMLEPWNQAMDLFERMGLFIWRRLSPVAGLLGEAVKSQIKKLEWIALELGPQSLALAGQVAENLATMLEPWASAMDIFERMATASTGRLNYGVSVISENIYQLINNLADVHERLADDALNAAGQIAETMAAISEPIEQAMATFDAIADSTANITEGAVGRLWDNAYWLITALSDVFDFLPQEALAAAQQVGETLGAIAEPIETALEVFDAIADFTANIAEEGVGRLRDNVYWLITALADVFAFLPDRATAIAMDLANTLGEISGPIREALGLFLELSLSDADIRDNVQRLWDNVYWLITSLSDVFNFLSESAIGNAQQVATALGTITDPLLAALDLFDEISIGFGDATQNLEGLSANIQELLSTLSQAWDDLGGSGVAADAIAIAEALGSIVQPILDAMQLFNRLGSFEANIEAGVSVLGDNIRLLVETLQTVASDLGDQALASAERVAGRIGGIIEPWSDAVDTFNAISRYVGRNIEAGVSALTENMAMLAIAMDSIGEAIGERRLERASRTAKLFAEVLEPWEAAMRLSDEMSAFRLMDDFVDKMTRFARQWIDIVYELERMVRTIDGEALDLVKDFASTLEALVDGLTAASDLLSEQTWMAPDPSIWDPFINWVVGVFEAFYQKIQDLTLNPENVIGFDPVNEFGEALESLMSGLASALEVAAEFAFAPPDPGMWQQFTDWVWDVFSTFYDLIEGLVTDPENTIGFDPVNEFGEALESLMSGLASALELVQNFVFEAPDPGMWDGFTTWVWDAFVVFYDWIDDLLTNPENTIGFDPVAEFGDALETLMGGLASVLELVQGFQFQEPDPAIWQSFFDWVTAVFQSFYDYLQANYPQSAADAQTFGPVQAFGEAMEAVMGGLSAALDVFAGILTFMPPFQQRIDAFLAAVQYVMNEIAVFAQSELITAAIDATTAFADAMQTLFSGLSQALTFFTDLADASDATGDFLAGASSGSDTSRFMQVMGYLFSAVHQTMFRFKELVVNSLGTDWLPGAQIFYDALAQVLDILRSALTLFTDLEAAGMPSPDVIQQFIDQILALFAQLTAGLLEAAPTLSEAVGGMIDTMANAPTQIITLQPMYHETGRQLAVSLATGISSSTDVVYNAGFEMGQTVKSGVNSALEIASPSRVLLEAGVYASEGFAAGLHLGGADVRQAAEDIATASIEPFKAIDMTMAPGFDFSNLAAQAATLPDLETSPVMLDVARAAAQAEFMQTRRIVVDINVGPHDLPAMTPEEMDKLKQELVYDILRHA